MNSKDNNVQFESKEITISDKLKALYQLQVNDSKIDRIKILRGELPLEVQDLEDEIIGLETRINNMKDEIGQFNLAIAKKKSDIQESKKLIDKFNEEMNNIKNNRQYDSLSKEIEFQELEVKLSEKKINELSLLIVEKKAVIEESIKILDEKKSDLQHKKNELNEIIGDTQKDEDQLKKRSLDIEKIIEPRLLTAYKRIRSNARNGLAVVSIQRNACGGCFNNIPPQRQLDISLRKKIKKP